MSTPQTRRVVLLAFEHMNLLDLSGPLQALATANRLFAGRGPLLYDTVVASPEGGLVSTSCGLPILTQPLSMLDGVAIDTIIASGGSKDEQFRSAPALVSWIAQRAPQVRRLCSVCTGAFLLAAAGQLDGRRAATHWHWASRLQAQYPGVAIDADRIFVQDGPVWTSAGVSAGIDLTLALIEADFGHRVAIDTARQLVMFIKRSGGQSQFSAPLEAQRHDDGRFATLHAWIAAHLADDLSVERLASQAGMTPRTFARLYAERVGRTPARTVEAMRLESARRQLEDTGLPLKTIAASTGHRSEQNLRRVFQRQLGVSPQQYRASFSAHATSPRQVDAIA